jgi:uncharacterized protein
MSFTSTTTPGTLTRPDSSRIFSIDVIRGIALLGILMISIWDFGGFGPNEQAFYRQGTHSGGNYRLWGIVSILFEGKMRALFAMVFGAAIILYFQKKEFKSTIGLPDLYIRRQIWLIVFGVVNAFILLWPNDILFHLGVMGILLYVFWRVAPGKLLIAAVICTLIYCGKNYWNYADDKKAYRKFLAVSKVEEKIKKDSTDRKTADSLARAKDSLSGKIDTNASKTGASMVTDTLTKKKDSLSRRQVMDKQEWEGIAKRAKYDSSGTERENKAMRASYTDVWDHLMPRSQNRESFWLYRIGIWDLSSVMFLGMALLGFGFFNHRFSNGKYWLIAIVSLAIGVFLAWLRIDYGNVKMLDYAKYIESNSIPPNQFFPIERILMAVGYASLVMLLLRSRVLNWLWDALSAVGRMALTNYILQTIMCTFFFYGYGFGFFGRLSQLELYFVVIEMWLVQIVFSVFWLRYYRLGPLEWLWRCLVYRKKLPNKLEPETTPTPAT